MYRVGWTLECHVVSATTGADDPPENGADPEAGLVWLDDSSDLAAIIEGQTP